MKTRVISACVLIILVVACFAISPVTRILFLLAALIMGIWEMCHAVSLKDIKCTSWVLYIYAVLATAGIFLMEGNSRSVMLFFLAVFAVFTVGICKEDISGPGNLGKPRYFSLSDRSPAHDNGFIAAPGLDTRFCDRLHLHLGVRLVCAVWRQMVRQA